MGKQDYSNYTIFDFHHLKYFIEHCFHILIKNQPKNGHTFLESS